MHWIILKTCMIFEYIGIEVYRNPNVSEYGCMFLNLVLGFRLLWLLKFIIICAPVIQLQLCIYWFSLIPHQIYLSHSSYSSVAKIWRGSKLGHVHIVFESCTYIAWVMPTRAIVVLEEIGDVGKLVEGTWYWCSASKKVDVAINSREEQRHNIL